MNEPTTIESARIQRGAKSLGTAVKELSGNLRLLLSTTDMPGSFLTVLSTVMTCIERDVSDLWKLAILFEINQDAPETNAIENIRFSSVLVGQDPMRFMKITNWESTTPDITSLDEQLVVDACSAAMLVVGKMVHGIVNPYYALRGWVTNNNYRLHAFANGDNPLSFTATYVAPHGLDGFTVLVDFSVLVRDHEYMLEYTGGEHGLIKL